MAIPPSRLTAVVQGLPSPWWVYLKLRRHCCLRRGASGHAVRDIVRRALAERNPWATWDSLVPGQLLFADLLSKKGVTWANDLGPAFPPLPKSAEVGHLWGGPHPVELYVEIEESGTVSLQITEGFDHRSEYAEIDPAEAAAILNQVKSVEPELSEIGALGHEPSDDLEEFHVKVAGVAVTFPVWDAAGKVTVIRSGGQTSRVVSPALEAVFRRFDDLTWRLFAQEVQYGATGKTRAVFLPRNLDASWETVAEHSRGGLIVVRFAGTYTSDGSFSRKMGEFLRSAITTANAAAVIIDLSRLDFGSGGDVAGLGALVMPLMQTEGGVTPAAVVANERSVQELKWLFEPNMILGVAGMKLFRDRDEALAHVQSALG